MIENSLYSFLLETDLLVNSPPNPSKLGFEPLLSSRSAQNSPKPSLHGLGNFHFHTMPSFSSTSIDKCSANLPSCKSNARHYEIPEFDNDTLALKLVDNKLDQHSFICIFIIDQNHADGNTRVYPTK